MGSCARPTWRDPDEFAQTLLNTCVLAAEIRYTINHSRPTLPNIRPISAYLGPNLARTTSSGRVSPVLANSEPSLASFGRCWPRFDRPWPTSTKRGWTWAHTAKVGHSFANIGITWSRSCQIWLKVPALGPNSNSSRTASELSNFAATWDLARLAQGNYHDAKRSICSAALR